MSFKWSRVRYSGYNCCSRLFTAAHRDAATSRPYFGVGHSLYKLPSQFVIQQTPVRQSSPCRRRGRCTPRPGRPLEALVVAAIADTLADYQAIRRRGGRPPWKTPSRPRAHRQPRPSDAEAVPLTEAPHRRGGWRPPRRARGWIAPHWQAGDGQ